jgi:flagellar hook-basal body complex protein FliE
MDMNINQVLNQIRVRSQFPANNDVAPPKTDFSALLQQTLSEVNNLQTDAIVKKTSYETGNSNIDLPEVMIATQKASLAFEAVTEVRNRVLNAYQEIMNMQV